VLRNILGALGPGVPFGLEAGLRYRATTHGMWGFAIIASPNLLEALRIGSRYEELTYSFNRFGFEIDEREVRLSLEDGDNPDDLRAALVERDWGAFIALQHGILGGTMPIQTARLRAPRPPYAARFRELLGIAPQFGDSVNCMTIDPALLTISSPLADPSAFRACEEQCRILLEQRRGRSGVAGRVRARLLEQSCGFPSMDDVAVDLGMSPRTLRNQLVRESTSYRRIVEEIRQAQAEELLSARRLNVDEVAARLGYSDRSSFIAAFKRWKGVSPGRYRAK
jgi:AraC-like DNA-binding protein